MSVPVLDVPPQAEHRINDGDPAYPGIPRVLSGYRHCVSPGSDASGGSDGEEARPILPADVHRFLVEAQAGRHLVAVFGDKPLLPVMTELEHLVRVHPDVLSFVAVVSQPLTEQLSQVHAGFDLARWLKYPHSRPRSDIFSQAEVEWPLVTLLLVAKWCAMLHAAKGGGWEWADVYSCLSSVSGFGRGLLAAVAVAGGSTGEDALVDASRRAVIAAFWAGSALRANAECMLPEEDKQEEYARMGFSLEWRGCSLPVMERFVAAVNIVPHDPSARTYSDVEVARVLSARAGTVVGHPSDLARLERMLRTHAQGFGIKVHLHAEGEAYPRNSSFLCKRLVREIVNLWRDRGIDHKRQHLGIPVVSPATGHSIGEVEGPVSSEIAACLVSECSSLLPLAAQLPDESRLIDFCSGIPSRWLLSLLRSTRLSAVTYPRGEIIAAGPEHATPRRSVTSSVRRATLLRIATVNEVLHAQGILPHRGKLGVDLFTTWAQLGLVRDDLEEELCRDVMVHGGCITVGGRADVCVNDAEGIVRLVLPKSPWGPQRICKSLTPTGLRVTDALSAVIGRHLPSCLLIECATVAAVLDVWECFDALDIGRLEGRTSVLDLRTSPPRSPTAGLRGGSPVALQ